MSPFINFHYRDDVRYGDDGSDCHALDPNADVGWIYALAELQGAEYNINIETPIKIILLASRMGCITKYLS